MENSQVKILKKMKYFLSLFNNSEYPEKNSIFYLNTTSSFIGSYIIQTFSDVKSWNFFAKFLIVLKDINYIFNYINYKIYKPKKITNYKKIIVTWAYEDNFIRNGSLNDRYLNVNSKEIKDCLWFVIYMSNTIPKKIDNNIVLFKPKTLKSYDIIHFFDFLRKNIFILFKNFKYYLTLKSNYNYFAEIFLENINEYLVKDLKLILMPFEGQPFQNKLVNLVKNKNKKIKTIGYIHSPPLPLPSNFLFRSGAPDKIILNGKDQIYCFNKILGWKKNNIIYLPSFRFLKKKKKINDTIYFPLNVINKKKIIRNIKFLITEKIINLNYLDIKNHPGALYSKNNIDLINQIKKIRKDSGYKNKSKNSKNFSIFIGTSGAIIEALERGKNVIQICDNPLFDIYSSKIWPSIETFKINQGVYSYKLKKKGALIKFGEKKNNLKKVLQII